MQRQREEAKRTGRFIDLTAMDDDDDEIQRAHAAIKQEDIDSRANVRKAAEEKTRKEEEKLMDEVVSPSCKD